MRRRAVPSIHRRQQSSVAICLSSLSIFLTASSSIRHWKCLQVPALGNSSHDLLTCQERNRHNRGRVNFRFSVDLPGCLGYLSGILGCSACAGSVIGEYSANGLSLLPKYHCKRLTYELIAYAEMKEKPSVGVTCAARYALKGLAYQLSGRTKKFYAPPVVCR